MLTDMSMLIIPAGQSLRMVAERLGVPVDELQKHAAVADPEATLPIEKRVEVPDGFLRSRATARQLKDAVVAESGRKGGMNMWLALDIEQKRTRASGGMKAHGAVDAELEALREARRAYCRFSADSNELAISLYDQITVTLSIDVRAKAFAGQACAFAQRYRMFGEPLERSRPQALSAAKAALLAAPKLSDAHLGMALAIGASGDAAALAEAQAELEQVVAANPQAGECWAELGTICLRQGRIPDAAAAVEIALEHAPDWMFALATAADLALGHGETERAIELLGAAIELAPECANLLTQLAMVFKATKQDSQANATQTKALEMATTDNQKLLLNSLFAKTLAQYCGV
ncbi:MAG: hypothetical protein A2289_01675 [Deltaproteobacteria bacterium RIFOXYA12_FULL_58_15]|nr:MAG: hypothetical protein A2289_01675 [Deltaproteobacteria bacterium RIFOXYA12_FULL_58_15]OGR08621.1 MAG: hypothetical protein A2341_00030 [Deltaproteobacteria bacterium RIFOXYB12_FULL_58_9]